MAPNKQEAPGKGEGNYVKRPMQKGGYPERWVNNQRPSDTSDTVERGPFKRFFGSGGGGNDQGYSAEPTVKASSDIGTKYYHDGKEVHWVRDNSRKNGHWEDEKGEWVNTYDEWPNGVKPRRGLFG